MKDLINYSEEHQSHLLLQLLFINDIHAEIHTKLIKILEFIHFQ